MAEYLPRGLHLRPHRGALIGLTGQTVALLGVIGALLGASACSDDQVLTTTRNLERPGPMVVLCATRLEGQGATGLGLESCRPTKKDDGSTEPAPGTLYGMVANTSRGDVALFRADGSGEPLIDLTPSSPGYGFVPVGTLPSDLVATADGCRVVTANAGSCDLSMIDVPGVLDVAARQRTLAAGGVVARIIPRTAAGPLLARPQEMVIIPSSVPDKADDALCGAPMAPSGDGGPADGDGATTDGDGATTDGATTDGAGAAGVGPYRAYVSFPGCNLVAEIDLSTGMVLRGAVFTASGVTFTSEPRCRAECAPRGGALPQDAGPLDLPPADLPPVDLPGADGGVDGAAPADAGPSDGGDAAPGDAAPGDAAPGDAAPGDAAPGDAAPGDAAPGNEAGLDTSPTDGGAGEGGSAEDATVPQVGGSGVRPHGLALHEDGSKLYVSSAGANFITVVEIEPKEGALLASRRILLAGPLAQTTRISLSPPTKAVGRFLYAIARDRSVRVISTEFERNVVEVECETNLDLARLADGGIPIDRARCFAVGQAGSPRRVFGAGTGLRFGARVPMDVTFVQNEGQPPDGGVGDARPAAPLRGTHALIAASDGTVYVIDVEDGNVIPSATATVFADHLPHRFRNALQGTEEGVPDAGVKEISEQKSGGVPVVVSAVDGTDLPAEGVLQRAPGENVPSEWAMVYEQRLLERYSGQVRLSDDATELQFFDRGADFCAAGVQGQRLAGGRQLQHGDILALMGCKDDDDCGLEQSCRKPVAQVTEFGLCLDKGRSSALFKECAFFLQQPRELLIREVWRDQLVIDALATEPQVVVLQDPVKEDCTANEDCADGYYCALDDRKVEGRPELSVTKGQCFRPGCARDEDCPSGRCVSPLYGAPKVCAPVPWPLEVSSAKCAVDAECRPPATGKLCDSDRDCDPLAECALPRSDAGQRECVDRGMRCAKLPALRDRCVRPSPCFAELLHYEVRAGRSFVVGSSQRQVAAADGRCVTDASRSPLFANRVPVGPTVYPVLFGPRCEAGVNWIADINHVPEPNPCVERSEQGYRGFVEKNTSGTEASTEVAGPTTLVRFANPYISFSVGLSHLTSAPPDPPTAVPGQREDEKLPADLVAPAMPERGLTITLGVSSGSGRMVVSGTSAGLALPLRLASAPDGRVYVVDMGDRTGATGTKGQVIRFDGESLALSTDFIVK